MNKKTSSLIRGAIRFSIPGALVGMCIGWMFLSTLYGTILGALLFASLFLVLRTRFALPIEILTPWPERGPRARTRVERLVEPFLAAIIGAQYGGIYFILGGGEFFACLLNGATIFFIVDFFYIEFIDTRVVERRTPRRR
jgi:hypothetical protein